MRNAFSAVLFLSLVLFLAIDVQAQNRSRYRDSLQDRLLVETNDTNRCRIAHLLTEHFFDDNTDSALYWADKTWRMVNDLKWEKGIAVVNSDYSTIYTLLGDQEKSIAYIEKSLKFNLKPGNERNLASNYINLAAAYQQLDNYSKALGYLYKALPLADALKDDYLKGIILGNLSDLFEGQHDFSKSKHYIKEQISLALRTDNFEMLSLAYLRMGQNHLETNQIDSSIIYLEKGLKISREREDDLQVAKFLSTIAVCYDDNHPKKMEFMLAAQKIFDRGFMKYTNSINNIGNIGGTYASMGLHDSLGKYSSTEKNSFLKLANSYLQKAVAYAKEMKQLQNVSYFSDNLAQVQEGMGDYRNALINFKLSNQIDDSLYSQENKNLLANKEAEYLEQLMQKKNKVHKLELQKFWLIGAIAFALLTIAAVLFIIYFRFQKIKSDHRLLQKEAEEKTKELLHQNNISESELKAIRSQMNPHFIFNVLNSLESYIMDNDKKSACKLVQKFAGLSRLILENSTHSLVQASKEWKALILYTELQALRYINNFTYQFTTSPLIDLNSLFIPPMLIQPLIENAILHGVLQSGNQNPFLKVSMEKHFDQIKITIEDNGPGISETKKLKLFPGLKEKSLGLQFIDDRIKMLNQNYDSPQASFQIENKAHGIGAIAILILPVWTGMEMKAAI